MERRHVKELLLLRAIDRRTRLDGLALHETRRFRLTPVALRLRPCQLTIGPR